MSTFLQLYKDNIGKTVTKTIIGALVGALITLGGYILFDSFPEKQKIENEFAEHIENIEKEIDQMSKISDHFEAGDNTFDNFANRLEFIISLSQRFEQDNAFTLTSVDREKANKFFKQNLLDSGLNSAIVADYKMEEDKQLEDALKLEKQILSSLKENPIVDKTINNIINDYIFSSKKLNDFVIISNKRLLKDLQKRKADKKHQIEFNKTQEKFKRNAYLNIAATEGVLLCSFLLVFFIFIAVKVGHLKE